MTQSPFPGMDPYLEARGIWSDVHSNLMNIFREQLPPLLAPKYTAELETEIVIDQILPTEDAYPKGYRPDVSVIEQSGITAPSGGAGAIATAPLELAWPTVEEVHLVSLKIRHRAEHDIVTAIELLSPINKRTGRPRQKYLRKRLDYPEAEIKLIELDLLRKYKRMPFEQKAPQSAYLVVSPKNRVRFHAWPLKLTDRLPTIPIPLRRPDLPVLLDIQLALNTAYQRARYDLRIDYSRLPKPPLTESEIAWLKQLLPISDDNINAV